MGFHELQFRRYWGMFPAIQSTFSGVIAWSLKKQTVKDKAIPGLN
jgi:hypothetical protein